MEQVGNTVNIEGLPAPSEERVGIFTKILEEILESQSRQKVTKYFKEKAVILRSSTRLTQLHALTLCSFFDSDGADKIWPTAQHDATLRKIGALRTTLQEATEALEELRLVASQEDVEQEALRYAETMSRRDCFLTDDFCQREIRLLLNSTLRGRIAFAMGDERLECEEGAAHEFACIEQKRIVVRTPPVTFSEDGVEVSFDGFYIHILLEKLRRLVSDSQREEDSYPDCIKVTSVGPPNRSYDDSHVIHPHVNSGNVCFGNAFEGVKNALKNGLISDAIFLTERVLATYNPDGPFVSICNWYGGGVGRPDNTCEVCQEQIEGDAVHTAFGVLHQRCAVFNSVDQEYYHPASLPVCNVCCGQVYPPRWYDIPVPERNGSSLTAVACAECTPRFRAEIAAAEEGVYQCPVCTRQYRGEAIDENKVVLGYRDYGCQACCRDEEDGTTTVGIGEDERLQRHIRRRPDVCDPRNMTRSPLRITPDILYKEECTCGAEVRIDNRSLCRYTNTFICPECDPEGLGFGSVFRSDIAYMEFWLHELKAHYMPAFDSDFIRLLSFFDGGFTTETAFEVVKTVTRNLERQTQAYSLALLRDKLRWWNSLAGDLEITLATGVEEEIHDQEIVRQWRRRAQAGDERAAQDLRAYEEEHCEEGHEDSDEVTVTECSPDNH